MQVFKDQMDTVLGEQESIDQYLLSFPSEVIDECMKSQVLIQQAETN